MKINAIPSARSIWLVPQAFLNPRGIDTRPALDEIKSRYKFLTSPMDNLPAPPGTAPAKGEPKFEGGSFIGKNGPIQIASLAIHNDGVVVDTKSSTDDSDAFLEDLTAFMTEKFGLPKSSDLPINRVYASEIFFSYEKTPVILNPKLSAFIDLVSSVIGNEKTGAPAFSGFQLFTDQTRANPARFSVDREVNTPIGANRYYSFAPTTTAIHIKLLGALEELAT